jgi:hypothetical protein
VFRKLAVNVAVNFRSRLVGMDDTRGRQLAGAHTRERRQRNYGSTGKHDQSHGQSPYCSQ